MVNEGAKTLRHHFLSLGRPKNFGFGCLLKAPDGLWNNEIYMQRGGEKAA